MTLGVGATFGEVMVLGTGKLGQTVLGTSATTIVNLPSIKSISIDRGRDDVFDHYNPGSCTITFLDTTGWWNPKYTAGPYYGKINPLNQMQITATYSGTTYYLFTGYVVSYDYQYQPGVDWATVTVTAVDGFRLLQLASITTVTGATAGETTGNRILDILNQISWPAAYQALDAGSITVQADPGSERSALSAIQNMEDCELGAFFMAKDGKATFYSRDTVSQKASTALANTRQYRDGTDTVGNYQFVDIKYDDQDLANVVTVTRSGGTTQTATNSASISAYYRRTLSRTGLLLQTDAQALAQANAILNYRDTAEMTIRAVGGDISVQDYTTVSALSLELCDPVYVEKDPIIGVDLTVKGLVQGIRHDITPDRWVTTIKTGLPLSTAFILGSSEYGILGTSTL
jgi:hypothetical protein